MKTSGVICCCLLALLGTATAYKTYAGYQVLRTAPLKDVTDFLKLKPLTVNINYDFWTDPHVGSGTDIMTSPEHVTELWNELTRLGLEPSVLIPDVGVVVKQERETIERMREAEKREGRAPALDRYLTYDEIQAYLDEVVAAFPAIATKITIGFSYEGRELNVLKVSNGPGKTGLFFDAVIHAREWMGPCVQLYSINELTENLAANQAMLDANDFYFLPVSNPDGYDYSWTTQRLWRKTRSPNAGSTCVGTDANRNYDWNWAGGGVPSPCDDTYPGSAAFSESESKAIADFLQANPQITMYISIHTYGQYLLHPWGDTYDLPPQEPELRAVAQDAMDALATYRGTTYQIGSIANVLYFAYGGSIDWTLGALNLVYSYAIELPGGGLWGFNPPPSDIDPVTKETWLAIQVFAANIPATPRG